jgi:hypothetical protein
MQTIPSNEAARQDRLSTLLAASSPPELIQLLDRQIYLLNLAGALRVSAELSARGIAPFVLGLHLNDAKSRFDDPEEDFIKMVCDLHWLVCRYPSHQVAWPRLRALYDQRRFMQECRWLHYGGQRSAAQISKALGLTTKQQRELAWIKASHTQSWWENLKQRWGLAQARIAEDVHSKPWRSHLKKEETISRRVDIWLSAELGLWKPQATANYYAMLTGTRLSRNVVHAQLQHLPRKRDLKRIA